MLCLCNDLIIKPLSTSHGTVHTTFETERVRRKKMIKKKSLNMLEIFVAFVLDETSRHTV